MCGSKSWRQFSERCINISIVGVVAESLCDLRDAVITIGRVYCFGSGLFDAIGRAVFVLEIVLDAAAAIAGVWISGLRGVLLEAFVCGCEIEAADALAAASPKMESMRLPVMQAR